MASDSLETLSFEVFGKHTEKQAVELGLVGWVRNTATGTVTGTVQGPAAAVALFKTWVSTKGSPKSVIANCEFKDAMPIAKLDFESFEINR
eukprot:jgi/Hompol1/3782/HPOL_006741-RA